MVPRAPRSIPRAPLSLLLSLLLMLFLLLLLLLLPLIITVTNTTITITITFTTIIIIIIIIIILVILTATSCLGELSVGILVQEWGYLGHVLSLHGVRRVPVLVVLCITAFHQRSGRSTCCM